MRENEEVITTQQRRVDMVREELARRGFPLTHGEGREELEQREEERRERLGAAAEVEVASVDGGAEHHLPDSGGRVRSGRRASGDAVSSGPGTFVGNIATQDSSLAAGTNEVGVVGHAAPVAEGVQGDGRGRRSGNAARAQELSVTPSDGGVNGIYL